MRKYIQQAKGANESKEKDVSYAALSLVASFFLFTKDERIINLFIFYILLSDCLSLL